MKRTGISPEELRTELLKFDALNRKRSKDAIAAVAEMSKHPLSLEQAREQIRQHHREAELENRRRSKATNE